MSGDPPAGVLSLRTARPEDAAEVAGVHVRAWQIGYRGLFPDDYLDALRPADRIARYTFTATNPGAPATVVALADGVVCGFATTGPSRDPAAEHRAEILALYVDPPAWGLGVGRRLMEEARARLDRRGYGEAVVWVLVGNDRGERFYRADGWRPDAARRTEDVWGVVADLARFRRRLP